MSRYINNFTEDEIIRVLRAYLVDGDSHRSIQKNILGLPAPARGGGFIVMDILHHFDIKGEHKGLLGKPDYTDAGSESVMLAVRKVTEYDGLENIALKSLQSGDISDFDDVSVTEIETTTKQRIGQSALRKVVLDNYSHRCALCNIHQDDLLVCSHIVPWHIDEANRLNPSNAILLCLLHDGLFEKGYFGLDDNFNIKLSGKADSVISSLLNGCTFSTPVRSSPDLALLKRHRSEICAIT